MNEIINKLVSIEAIRIYVILFASVIVILGITFLVTSNMKKPRQIVIPRINKAENSVIKSEGSSEEVDEETLSRFPTLYSLDLKYPIQRKVKTPASLSLKGICNKV